MGETLAVRGMIQLPTPPRDWSARHSWSEPRTDSYSASKAKRKGDRQRQGHPFDRLLATAREVSRQGRRRTTINTPLRKSIAVRTFTDWNDPPPGFFEMDMVAHCGKSVAGRHVHSLVLTDIASGWTEACALVVREQTLITVKVDEVRARLPFRMLGLDVDNDSAFINETLVGFCGFR